MKNILKYNKIILVIYIIAMLCFNIVPIECLTAATNGINVSGPNSVEEGKTITFNVTFSNNVENIWLSDGDIIKKGFSGTVKVNKITDRTYTIVISNISNVGTGKYIVINSGVGYINDIPVDSVSSNVFEVTAKKPIDNDNDNNNNNNNDNNNNNNNNNNNTLVCDNTWGNWTTEYKNDPSLEFEKRILIKAYKVNKTYGEWSQPVKEKPTASNTLEVKEEQKKETTTEYTDWSSKSTSKPTAKEGREIDTQTVKKSYKKKSCTPGENYTKNVKGRDSKALYCKPINDTSANKGNGYYYTCTYKGEETCKTITKYKNITYYSYRDKVEKEITTTYYQTRTVSENTVYTDYILEKDIPSGYIKLSGSEITQYRYRQVCSK